MPSILIGVTEEGIVTDWNAFATKEMLLLSDEIKGQSIEKIKSPFNQYLYLVKEALETGEVQTKTKIKEKIEGHWRYFNIVAYPILGERKRGAVIRIDDVTIQVQLEEQISQSAKMSSLGGLAAGVAHEINNPLGAIVQGGQNVLRRLDIHLPANVKVAEELEIDLAKYQEYLEKRKIPTMLKGLLESGEKAAEIVSNLLLFTKTGDVQKQEADIVQVIEKAIEMTSYDSNLKRHVDFQEVHLNKYIQSDLPKIYCNAQDMENVMVHLLKNAAYELRNQEKKSIDIRCSMVDELLVLEVKDNGPGFDEKIKDKLFEPFFSQKSIDHGTGLGLAICHTIVCEQHHGEMEAESVQGEYAAFKIRLPFEQPETPTQSDVPGSSTGFSRGAKQL